MQDHELAGLLGPAYDESSVEQRERVRAAVTTIQSRYPDDAEAQACAGAAALEVILGDNALETIAAKWHAVRAEEADAHARLTGAIVATAAPETTIAQRAGVTRMTVRKALGK